jgi:hypothetical protein
MKIGDLVKMNSCPDPPWADYVCECFFCNGNSSRVGIITGKVSRNSWRVMFDCGDWRVDNFEEARGEIKVISESL